MAIQGMFLPGDHVITTQLEHNSVLRPLYAMQKKGVELTIAASGFPEPGGQFFVPWVLSFFSHSSLIFQT